MSHQWDMLCKTAVAEHVQKMKNLHAEQVRDLHESIANQRARQVKQLELRDAIISDHDRKRATCVSTIMAQRADIKKLRAKIRKLQKEARKPVGL